MLTIEKFTTMTPEQWVMVIEGMRNPKNSWARSDSYITSVVDEETGRIVPSEFFVGENDLTLMKSLAAGGPVHAKYRRMMPVWVTINAPLYWWKEFDTYKVGTVCNSCSTMHKIHAKEIELSDFSIEHLSANDLSVFKAMVYRMEANRKMCLALDGDEAKEAWYRLIQLLPSCYNQKRTIMLTYEVLANMRKWRKNHKLDEWHVFCDWIESLPYSELITGEDAPEKEETK